MPTGPHGPIKPLWPSRTPQYQYLNVLSLAGEGDGAGASTGTLLSGDRLSGYSSGIGDASNWFLDTGIFLDDGHYFDTEVFAAASLLEGATLSGSSGGIGISAWLLDSGVLFDDGIHYLDTSASPLLELALLAGEGDGVGGGSLSRGESLAEGGPYIFEPARIRRPPPVPERIPVHIQVQPTVVEVEILKPDVLVAIDNRAIIAALYASGAIDEEEFTALMAA